MTVKHHVKVKESQTHRKPGRGADSQSEEGPELSLDLQCLCLLLINDCVDKSADVSQLEETEHPSKKIITGIPS